MAGIKNSFGLNNGTSKTRLVADLNDEYKKLNTTLKETEKLSKSIATNLKSSSNGPGSSNSMNQMTPPPGPSGPPGPPGPGGPGGPGGPSNTNISSSYNYGSAFRAMAGSAVDALTQGVDASSYITNDIARRRFGFFSGVYSNQNDNIGTIAGAKAFATMSSRGTPTSALDAANAAMAGNSSGLMSGLKNYNTIINSTAGISNVMPGVGLEGGMGAVSALNQGSSVNKLRMIGINVRDQKGFMRDVEDIARDLWKTINNTKSGNGTITESDLSYSLQSGNSLAMLLDQYFGTDAVLKQSIISYLFQFAKNNGAKVGGGYQTTEGKAALLKSGANPGITQSIGTRNAIGGSNINAYTTGGVLGIQSANDTINNFTKMATTLAPVLQAFVTATTFTQTLTSAGNGAGGIITKDLLEGAKGVAKGTIDAVGPFLKNPMVLAVFASMWATLSGISSAQQQQDEYLTNLIGEGKATPDTKGTNSFGTKQDQILRDNPDLNAYLGNPTKYDLPSSTGVATPKVTVKGSGKGVKPAAGVGIYKMSDTSAGWSKKLLAKLGAPVSNANVAAIQEWMQHENTASSGYLGERNSPLNMGWDPTGKSVGKDQWGRAVYSSESAGIDATAMALTSTPNQGYEQIVNLLKSGRASENNIWSAISGSNWNGDNHYGASGRMFYNGAPININISNAANMDPVALARAIQDALDEAAIKAAATGSGGGGH